MSDGSTHSPLGASSAERWMKCPGSTALINALGPDANSESEYAAEGTLAHEVGAYCLRQHCEAWEAMVEFPALTAEMATAVQTYLNYGAAHPPQLRLVEHHISHPAFHKQMFGTLDRVDFEPEPDIALEMIDYKHGIGIAVDATGNAQLRYYAFALISGETWPADRPRLEDKARIKLTIVQPRGFHPDGPIRSEIVRVGDIRNWAYNELRPAMERAGELTFDLGEHCRFCPAKLICPAMNTLAKDAELAIETPVALSDDWLGGWYGRLSQLKMFIKALEDETAARMLAGKTIPNAKLVYGRVERIWKADAAERGEALFGDEWAPRRPRSPAQIQALPGGPDFVAEYAEKPQAPLVVAPMSDKRAAQKAQTSAEVFSDVIKSGA
jgi:hypothetical protein